MSALIACYLQDDGTQVTKITRHSKGCSCRKSHCLKKYCECFQAGIFCAGTCRCKDCRNFQGSAALATLMEAADVAASRQVSGTVRTCPCMHGACVGKPFDKHLFCDTW
jgi:Tesmin/TSO1-like CXC domain, cysteine-rich domain